MSYFLKGERFIYVLLFFGVIAWLFFNGLSGVCSVEPVKSIFSPSGGYRVDVQYRSCGGRGVSGLEVLLSRADTENKESEVLWVSRDSGRTGEGAVERKVSVLWVNDETLRLSVPGEIRKERMALGEIRVKYVGY